MENNVLNAHTPGPWKANLYLGGAVAIDRVKPNGDRIAHIADVYGMQARHNAILIALAPEMYDLIATLENGNGAIPEWLWAKRNELLAKANAK